MRDVGRLIRDRRNALGLSVRDLASLAGVAFPALSRIENGHTDPRWSTVGRLADALGWELAIAGPARELERLGDLADAWSTADGGDVEPDWTRLRAFADYLARHRCHTWLLIADPPEPSGSALLDNLLAGVAEKCADDAGIRRPVWTRCVAPLKELWEPAGTPRMREANAASTPPQLAARNITLAESTIWRNGPSATCCTNIPGSS